MIEVIGRRIREARKARGWSLDDLSRRVGISIAQLSKLETGRANYNVPALMKVGAGLERPMGYFFQTDSEMPRCLGTLVPPWDAEGRAIDYFADLVRENSDDEFSIAVFSASQLGSAVGQLDGLMNGLIDMFVESLNFCEGFADPIRVASLPYCFHDDAHYDRFLRSRLFDDEVRRVLRGHSIEVLNAQWNWKRGPYVVIVARRPITTPDELAGLRVRCYESDILVQFLERLGAIPVVVPWGDTYDAFESGEFDAMLTNLSHVVSMRFTRIAPCVTVLAYRPLDLALAVNAQKYDMLSPALQLALRDAARLAGERCSQLVQQAEDDLPKLLEEDNAVIMRVGVKPWRDRSRAVIRDLERDGAWRDGLFDEIQAL
jgi:TRAP-type C4-dicarboxylate transport system substrate-binding protein